jgi:prolyl oligopeptidase
VTDTFDPTAHAYLEDIEGEEALAWVMRQNVRSLALLQDDPRYHGFRDAAYAIVTSDARIPYGAIRGGYVYNFWTDAANPLGVWRRMRLADYIADAPREKSGWELILDVDALAKADGRKWVFKGVDCLPSDRNICLVRLSEGGKDASIEREFDIATKSFVRGGFELPEAKSNIVWGDKDTLLIATDWGKASLTSSGYPFIVKALKRGQALADAVEIFRGQPDDVLAAPFSIEDAAGRRWTGAMRAETFFESSSVIFPDTLAEGAGGAPLPVPLPGRASIRGVYQDLALVTLDQAWTPANGVEGQEAFQTGDLVSFSWSEFLSGGKLPRVELVLRPTPRQAIQAVNLSKTAVLITLSDNVVPKVFVWRRNVKGWTSQQITLPDNGSVSVVFADVRGDQVFLTYESFISPDALYLCDVESGAMTTVMQLPAWFDASAMLVEQHAAASSDGVQAPYFVVRRRDMKFDGSNPTLLYAYGGFQVSLPPAYSGAIGKLWLEQGGVYVMANIRGGGEFGPAWHEAGLKTKRQIVYDDFTAVARDLIARSITTPAKLGAMGGSNGGLLMGVMFTQQPELFRAIVCQVPLLDMIGFTHLGAGASWIGEYGDPDDTAHPEERAFLQKLSPYHNVMAGAAYPEIFLETSTKDDRVHPAHARKMARRLEDLGKPFLYFENVDGGHAAASTPEEAARRQALEFVYLSQKLIDAR